MAKREYERLRLAYAFFAGIPAKRFYLDAIVQNDGNWDDPPSATNCNTLACGMGWLGLSPFGNALGLRWDDFHHELQYHNARCVSTFHAVGQVFGLSPMRACQLFDARHNSERRGEYATMTDKEVLLRRIRHFLNTHGGGCEHNPGDDNVPADDAA